VVTCFVSSPLHPPLCSTPPAPPCATPPAPILRHFAPETPKGVRLSPPPTTTPHPPMSPPTPLESTPAGRPVSVDSKPLTPILTPFFAPLTKIPGGGGAGRFATRRRQLGIIAYSIKANHQLELLDSIRCALSSPFQAAAAALVRGTVSRHSALSALKILLVEGNAVNRVRAVRRLEMRGHTLEVALNSNHARIVLEREEFNRVLATIEHAFSTNSHHLHPSNFSETAKNCSSWLSV
jgi:hypothetical protein